MGPALTLLLAALLAAPEPGSAAARPRAAAHARARDDAPARLAEARARLRALVRDPVRRRLHQNWDRAIAGILAAARGREAGPATLEAARARYALYRWSADEADRDQALLLAARASRLGAASAAAFARAVRREAGDERAAAPAPARPPRPALAPARPGRPAAGAAARPMADPASDPELSLAVAELDPAPALSLGASAGDGPATVSRYRTWTGADYTRVAIYLDHWVGWQHAELPAGAGRPRRLVLDLRPARLSGGAAARPVAGDQVDQLRLAQRDPGTVRLALDLHGAQAVHFFALQDPPRLIVDVGSHPAPALATARAPRSPGAGPVPPPGAAPPGEEDGEGSSLGRIRRVVVDAGHGGVDPGAIGPGRVREKDVTLALARRLAAKLERAGFEVVMTRRDDRTVPLEERTAIANARRGDLFVSIHANASPQRSQTGIETWVLDVSNDRYAARLAARENGLDPAAAGAGSEVHRILTDLDATASAGASRRLAALVQRDVTGAIRARVGPVQDLGVKSALFYVLIGARMPAVLVETAFISNRSEERRLASDRYQDAVADAVARAVTEFAGRGPRVAGLDRPASAPRR